MRLYDDKSQAIGAIENDITIGQHDIRIISGSTLPATRWQNIICILMLIN